MDYRFNKLGQYLRAWMGYFGILRVIPTDSRIGRMATPTCTLVLLEIVAPDPHEDQPLFGFGRRQVDGDCYGSQR